MCQLDGRFKVFALVLHAQARQPSFGNGTEETFVASALQMHFRWNSIQKTNELPVVVRAQKPETARGFKVESHFELVPGRTGSRRFAVHGDSNCAVPAPSPSAPARAH